MAKYDGSSSNELLKLGYHFEDEGRLMRNGNSHKHKCERCGLWSGQLLPLGDSIIDA